MTISDLGALYLRTLVSIEENSRLFPAARSMLVHNSVVHVLTAWNPGVERPSRQENDSANEHLRQILAGLGLIPCRAVGADPDANYFEESWAVTGLDDHEARAIGTTFGQVAVFRIFDGIQTVLACSEDWSLSRPL